MKNFYLFLFLLTIFACQKEPLSEEKILEIYVTKESHRENEGILRWAFLTNSKGELIADKSLQGGENLLKYRTPLDDSRVDLNILKLFKTNLQADRYSVDTYLDIKKVKVWLHGGGVCFEFNDDIEVFVEFISPIENYSVNISAHCGSSNIAQNYACSDSKFELFKNENCTINDARVILPQKSNKIFSNYFNHLTNQWHYDFFEDMTEGDTIFWDYQQSNYRQNGIFLEMPLSDLGSNTNNICHNNSAYSFFGYRNNSSFRINQNICPFFDVEPTLEQIPFFYPTEIFDKFFTHIIYNGYSIRKFGSPLTDFVPTIPSFEIEQPELEKISISSSNTPNHFVVSWHKGNNTEGGNTPSRNYFTWRVYGAFPSNYTHTLPKELPKVIERLLPNELKERKFSLFSVTEVHDDRFENYKDFLNFEIHNETPIFQRENQTDYITESKTQYY